MVASADGYLYIYNVDPAEGQECTLLRQFPYVWNNLSDSFLFFTTLLAVIEKVFIIEFILFKNINLFVQKKVFSSIRKCIIFALL